MVEHIRGRPGGRFRVTPLFNLVIVFAESGQGVFPFLAGRIDEPFRLRDEGANSDVVFNVDSLTPGSNYPGPTDKANGTFKFRQKRGGVIERREGAVFFFASTEGQNNPLEANARRCLSAWKSLGGGGFTFYINRLGHAWYRTDGQARFLAMVPGGFAWPDTMAPSP